MYSVFQFDRSEHAFASQPLSIQNLVDVERPHNPWNTPKMWQVKLARAVWTRYRMPNCHPLRGTILSGKRASGPQSCARMISSRLTLSALPVGRFACSLGTAAHRLQDAVWCQARVVYCKPLEKPRFAVGLELFTRVDRWAKPPWQQGSNVSRIHLEPIATVLLLQSCFRLQQAGCVSRDPPRN
jgi:hypothetical protein